MAIAICVQKKISARGVGEVRERLRFFEEQFPFVLSAMRFQIPTTLISPLKNRGGERIADDKNTQNTRFEFFCFFPSAYCNQKRDLIYYAVKAY